MCRQLYNENHEMVDALDLILPAQLHNLDEQAKIIKIELSNSYIHTFTHVVYTCTRVSQWLY